MCFGSSVCLWGNVYVDLLICSVGSFFSYYWVEWAVCVFWRLVPSLSHCWQIFSSIPCVVLLFMVTCCAKAHELHLFFSYIVFFLYLWLCQVILLSGLLWLQCMGFSLQWLLSLQSTGSRARAPQEFGYWALEHRLSSFGTGALLLCPMWDLLKPRIEPVSTILTGVFFTTTRETLFLSIVLGNWPKGILVWFMVQNDLPMTSSKT